MSVASDRPRRPVRALALCVALAAAASLQACLPEAVAHPAADALQRRAQALLADHQPRQAEALFEQAFEQDPTDTWLLFHAARASATAGDVDRAFTLLERARTAGFVHPEAVEGDAAFAPLHADARWPGALKALRQARAEAAKLYDSPALATPWRDDLPVDEKIAGLSKLWSEVKYNFVDTRRLQEIDWDRQYLEALPRVRATTSTLAYYRVLMDLLAQLHDGHSNVWPPFEVMDRELARPLLWTRLVDGHVMVRQALDPALVAAGVVPGTEIETVDGEPVRREAERDTRPWQSASTPQDADWRTYGFAFLTGPVDRQPRVGFRDPQGRRFTLPVRRVGWNEWSKVQAAPDFELRWLPGRVALVTMRSFQDDAVANAFLAHFDELAGARAWIIDVRDNGGGNSSVGHRVLATMTRQPFATGRWATRDYKPTYRAWGRAPAEHVENDAPVPPDLAHAYDGPVLVLTSPGTYSAAEDFVMAFQAMHRGRVVGEPTGGSTGQPLSFVLPGGGGGRVCTKRDTFPDGRPFVGIGLQPDVAAAPTRAGVQAGRDEVLERAQALLLAAR